MKWNYHNPVALHGGRGSLGKLPELLAGRRALLVAFPEADELGVTDRLSKLLGNGLAGVELDVLPNPDVNWLSDMYGRVWRKYKDVECLIALGGGSSMDCAKALMSATPSGTFYELLDYLRTGKAIPFCGAKSLIAVPTTAGTGSEVTPWATVWDKDADRKYSLHLPWTWAEHAILDPELMITLPAGPTLSSGLDALSHALEAVWNVNRNPVSFAHAARAIELVRETLPLLMNDLDNVELRESMSNAALEAGLAFSNTKTALAHSISYDFTLHAGLPHGIACSFCLPRVMEKAFGVDPGVDAFLLDVFQAETPALALATLREFLEGLGVSTRPGSYGVTEEEWAVMMKAALAGPRGRNFITAG